MSIKALLVDRDDLFRRITRTLLHGYDDVKVVGEAGDVSQAEKLIRSLGPQVVLWDVNTLDAGNLQSVALVAARHPEIKIIVLSVAERDRLVLEALRRGACGHLVKGRSTPLEIVEAMHTVTTGQSVISSAMAGWILDEMAQQRHNGSLVNEG